MRRYSEVTIPASIKQKTDIAMRYGKPSRQLTAEDFEIVKEHTEERLVEVRCDICGVDAEYFEPTTSSDECESSLISLQLWKGTKEGTDAVAEVTAEFIHDYWYEVCEPCMSTTIIPALKSLRRISIPERPLQEDEPAMLEGSVDPRRLHEKLPGSLIGEEEREQPPQLPPLADNEPF